MERLRHHLKPPSPPREPTMPPGFDRPTRRSALQGAVPTPGGTGSVRSVFFPSAADTCLPCRHRQAEVGALK
jgi:hypothetical protein